MARSGTAASPRSIPGVATFLYFYMLLSMIIAAKIAGSGTLCPKGDAPHRRHGGLFLER